jgi:ATP-dependent 26S proteasome regulatory subunit
MLNKTAIDKIKIAFAAQIPIAALQVISPEEIPTVTKICNAFTGENVYYWSLGTNQLNFCLIDHNGELIATQSTDYEGMGEAFSSILHYIRGTNNDGLYILGDMQKYISAGEGLEDVISLLKAMYNELKGTGKKILFMGQNIRLHDSLIRLIGTFTQELPTENEIKEHVQTYLSAITNSQPHISFDIRLDSAGYTAIAQAALAMSIEEVSDFLRQYIVTVKSDKSVIIDIAITDQILVYKTRILKQLGIELAEPAHNEFGGLNNLRQWLQKRKILFTKNAVDFGLPKPKGIFLAGPPGTGKSLIAKNISKILRMPLLKLELAGMLGSLVGESENNVKRALEISSSVQPCILWIDEVDKVLQGQSDSTGVSQRILGLILEWMQEQSGVFVVATANNVERLPAEFLRKGRFDEIFFVDLPNETERLEVLGIHLAKYNSDIPTEHLESIAAITSEFSGAEIEAIVTEAAISAFEESAGETCVIRVSHLADSAKGCNPLAKTNSSQIKLMREWAKNARPASQQTSHKAKATRLGTSRLNQNHQN